MRFRLRSLLCFIPLVISLASFGQDETIRPYLEAWQKAGKDQSYASQVFFDSLRLRKDPASREKYWGDIHKLYRYLDKHPDRRLRVRLMMFEIMAAREHSMAEKYSPKVEQAIKLAYPLHDEQLNAELYSIRGDIPFSRETQLLYNLKAIEIQKKIGYQYFPYTHNRFFDISAGLHYQKDYKRSIYYGKQFLIQRKNEDSLHLENNVLIYQYDLLGSSYLHLGQYDSARNYYRLLIGRLKYEPDSPDTRLWHGIASGNIAMTLIGEKRFVEAAPLLAAYLEISQAYPDTLNIAMAQNAFAAFYYGQKKYRPALAAAQRAWKVSGAKNLRTQMIKSLEWMTSIYTDTRQYDSAFYYLNLQNKYREIVRQELKDSEFSTIRAQVDFDRLQNSLVLAEVSASQERDLRKALIAGAVLLAVIAALLYNRKHIKDKNSLKEAVLKHEAAELKIAEARERIALFTDHLVEKNNLIGSLQQALEKIQPASIPALETLLRQPLFTEEGWEKFRTEFLKAYPYFFAKLHTESAGITPAMERLAALIFLQLDNYQIATALGIGKDSVARSKRRLRTALDLPDEIKLEDFISTLNDK